MTKAILNVAKCFNRMGMPHANELDVDYQHRIRNKSYNNRMEELDNACFDIVKDTC